MIKVVTADNYGDTFYIGKAKLPCYSKRQMQALFPNKMPPILFAYANRTPKQKENGQTAIFNDILFPVYPIDHYPKFLYQTKGYVKCENSEAYLRLCRSRIPHWILLSLIICILLGLAIGFLIYKPETPPLPMDPHAVVWQGEEVGSASDKLTFDSITSMRIPANTEQAAASFHNPKSNKSYCVVSLWVQVDAQWEELYQSSLLAPGQALYQIKLNHSMTQGQYPAYVKYTSYSKEEQKALNAVVFHFTLAVE